MTRRLFTLLLVAGTLSGCKTWSRRNLTVELVDVDGKPITNATVTVLSPKGKHGGWCREDDCYHISTMSDSNGVASVNFWACRPHFDWQVDAPSHYNESCRSLRHEQFEDGCLIRGHDCRQNGSRCKSNNVKAQRSLQIITNICRKVVMYPKRNPQPMYAYSTRYMPELPTAKTVIQSNGFEVVAYAPVDYDLKNSKVKRSTGKEIAKDCDFRLERYCVETNGVRDTFGRIVFAPGCGAYRCKKTGDLSFPTTYAADTNMVFESAIDFRYVKDLDKGVQLPGKSLIDDDEYLVLRTRMALTESGSTNGWHYSKLVGPAKIGKKFSMRLSVFNHRFNDSNLELDIGDNLGHPNGIDLLP